MPCDAIHERETNRPGRYDTDECKKSIIRDFQLYRVRIDIEDFMKHVLHVPDDWRDQWGPAIKKIKADNCFKSHHQRYHGEVERDSPDAREHAFRGPLMDLGNAILDVASEFPLKTVGPQTTQRTSPLQTSPGSTREKPPSHLQSSESTLVDESCAPGLETGGHDPGARCAGPPEESRYQENSPSTTFDLPPSGEATSTPPETPATSRKRPADRSSEPIRKVPKLDHRSTPSSARIHAEKTKPILTHPPHWPVGQADREEYIHVGKYLLEQFSYPDFRTHATVGLVRGDRIRFYHANHSVILISSPIDLEPDDRTGGLDMLIAIVIAFRRLSLSNNNVLRNPHNDRLSQDDNKPDTSKLDPGTVRFQEGKKIEFGGDGKTGPFTVEYDEVIAHELFLANRGTTVLRARSSIWDGDLVVKIGWPNSSGLSEIDFLEKAIEEAKGSRDQWALKHLPKVLFAQDVVFDPDSTHGKVASLFDNAEFANGRKFDYEQRTLRIIVQERLYPIKTLTTAREFAQVFLDTVCIHRWLYEVPGILHQDLSLRNIMYRLMDGKIYGVLMDYDISAWRTPPTSNGAPTPKSRCGTLLFMSHELLADADEPHLYRHEVESFFYMMLFLTTQNELRAPPGGEHSWLCLQKREGREELPYNDWVDRSSRSYLSCRKSALIRRVNNLDLSPSFEDFGDWLRALYRSLRQGYGAKQDHQIKLLDQWEDSSQSGDDESTLQFDDETLGGHVCYSSLIDPVRNLKGELENLKIRYEGTASVDA